MREVKSIMLIDDDPINNLISRETIRHYNEHIHVIEYERPDEALDFFKQQSKLRVQNLPNIIFLDLKMPILDGWQFIEDFKHILQYFNHDIELYLLSSSTFHKDIQKANTLQIVSNYITKPLTIEVLQKIVKEESL